MKKILVSLLFVNFSLCIMAQTASISAIKKISDPVICLVTSNDGGTENEVHWDPQAMPEAEIVIIFRLNEKGDAVEIGRQAAKEGMFIDTGINRADPTKASYNYFIKYKDKEGKLSAKSLDHQTIFVNGDQKGLFTWNAYEIAPKDANGKVIYHLWRQTKGDVATDVLTTEETSAVDPKFDAYKGQGTIWWISLGNFECDSQKRGTKSNNSNE